MEERLGTDFGEVRIHTGHAAQRLAHRVNANAFTIGSDVFFGKGRYEPNSASGRRRLTHELTHVAQGLPGRDPGSEERLQRLRDLLDDDEESDAIALMRSLSLSESQQVLRDSSFRNLAVSAFNDSEMLSGVRALGGDLYETLLWLFAEGNSWDDVRAVVVEWGEGYSAVRSSIVLKNKFVDLLDNDEMSDLVDLLGGSLRWKLRWLEAEGTSWSIVSNKLDNATAAERLALYDDTSVLPLFVDICDNAEMAQAANKLGGTVVQKFEWVQPEGASYYKLMTWIREAPLADRLALYSSGRATAIAVEACNDTDMRRMVNAIGGTVQMKLSWLLAEGEFDYMPTEGETLPAEPPPPVEAHTAPVIFGIDRSGDSREIYASVTAPGHPRDTVAQYLFGVSGEILAEFPDTIPAGMTIPLTGRRLSESARAELDRAIDTGTALSTEGSTTPEVAGPSGETMLYDFIVAGRSYQLTPQQMLGMIRGTARKLRIESNRIFGLAETLKEVRNWHDEGSNSAVRGISDTLGDVDLPDEHFADRAMSLARSAREQYQCISVSTSIAEAQSALPLAQADLQAAAHEHSIADMYWRYYIRGTIEGASTAITTLEITRNVCIGVAAALAGAVAAPFVFAAAGGGLVGGTAAVGAGTVVGAGTGTAIAGTGSVAGEALAMAITPGEQSFDTDYVLETTWEGTKTGAIQGGIGAAGALVAPGLSNVVAQRMFGAPAMALTGGQRLAANAVTASIVGGPSGGAGTAIENLDDLIAGEMSGGEYGTSILTGTGMGIGMGAATSWIPISGLYRSGGRAGNPFSGEVVTPRWMMEGIGFHPHQVSPDFRPTLNPFRMGSALSSRYSFNPTGSGFASFNALPLDQLPPLAPGHRWVRLNGEWHPIALSGRFGAPYSLRIQGDSYIFLMGHRGTPQQLLMSRAITRPAGSTYSNPQGRAQQAIRAFDEVSGSTTTRHTPGHNVDFADTPTAPLRTTGELGADPTMTNLNRDPFNFTPEPRSSTTAGGRSVSDWGQYLRNNMVRAIRSAGGGYRQYNMPSSTGRVATGTRPGGAGTIDVPVPDSVIFVRTDANGSVLDAWSISFTNPPTSRSVSVLTSPGSTFRINPNTIPQASLATNPVVVLPVGGEAAVLQAHLDAIVSAGEEARRDLSSGE
jgi:hypothetical protein